MGYRLTDLKRNLARLLILFWWLLLLTGCAFPPSFPNPFASPTPTPTATPTAEPSPTPAQDAREPTPTPGPMTLVWWTPIWFSPQGDDPAAAVLAQAVEAFEKEHPGIRVQALPKRDAGKGSVLDYLEGAYKVAPSLLPDVATVNMQDLPALQNLGILRPLDTLLPEEVTAELYPVARTAGTIGNSWVAVQATADFYHLVYRRPQLSSPPASWDAVLNSETRYAPVLFREGGRDTVADTVLLQYWAAGGPVFGEEAPPLDDQALLSLYSFYDQAIRRGVIPREMLRQAGQPEALWQAIVEGAVDMSDVSARLFVQQGLTRADLAPASIPTWDGRPRALIRGWGLVITANTPERQEAAATWVAWLLQPDVLGQWSQHARRIPLSRAALERWNAPGPYVQGIDVLLQNASPYVEEPHVPALRRALAIGLRALLDEGATPEEATRQARDAYLAELP